MENLRPQFLFWKQIKNIVVLFKKHVYIEKAFWRILISACYLMLVEVILFNQLKMCGT